MPSNPERHPQRHRLPGIFDVPYEKVTKEQRYRAKTVNFRLSMGRALTTSPATGHQAGEAKELIDQYFLRYPWFKNYMDKAG